MNNPSEISKEWYAYAERDLISANHLVKTLYPVPLEIVCYHCQQSSEKFLKGYIADQNTNKIKAFVNNIYKSDENAANVG